MGGNSSTKDSNICTLYTGKDSLDQKPGDSHNFPCKAFDFIETKSECEQAVAQFGLWAVREAIQPAWAYGCVFNKKTGLPWFNHAGRKKIQPKANEYAICRNHACTEEDDGFHDVQLGRLECEKWAQRKKFNLARACSSKRVQNSCKRTCCLLARKSISSLLEPPKTRAEPVAKSGYRKFLTCHERKTGFLRLQRKYALKQEYNKSTFEPISLGTCYAICDQSADCVGFLWERTSCVWCNSKRKLSFNSTCTTPYYEKQYMGVKKVYTRPIAGNGLAQIGFVKEICGNDVDLPHAMDTWSVDDLYPPAEVQCVDHPHFLKSQDAPETHCARGDRFNQFVLESLMLRRWLTSTWDYPEPVVVLPSIFMHCMAERLGKPKFSTGLGGKIDAYWNQVKRKFYDPELGYKPVIVMHMSLANDNSLINRLIVRLARQQPADFVNRVVIGLLDGANFRHEVTEALAQAPAHPLVVTLPCRYHNRYGDKPVRYALKNMFSPHGNTKGSQTAVVCNHGGPEDLCGIKHTYPKPSAYIKAANADFCLEPAGDTPTRSHLYLSVLNGCIPVIFDHEHQPVLHDHNDPNPFKPPKKARRLWYIGQLKHGNFNDLETGWAWRHTPDGFRLNYSEFAVVVDVGLKLQKDGSWSQPSLRSIINKIGSMPKTDPQRFHSLRRGVDRAAAWMRYATHECDSPNCDAFAVFKGLVYARAKNFTRGQSDPANISAPLNLPKPLPARCGRKCTWTLVSSDHGCNQNDEGISERWRSYFFPKLKDCQMSCAADRMCSGVDFDNSTSLCITFPKACTSPGAKGFAFYELVRS